MNRVLILHYHEIWLKGGNKNFFLSRLISAVKASLADLPIQSLQFIAERLLLTPRDEMDIPNILERLRRVFGLAYIALARETSSELDGLSSAARELMA